MNSDLMLYGAPLVLAGLAVLIIPMLRHRADSRVTPAVIALVLIFPVAVALIYSQTTTVNWDIQQRAAELEANPTAPVDDTIRALAERLKANPDPEGWVLLGRSYATLGRYQEAADAMYEAWNMTQGENVDINIDYAEALILSDQRTLRTSAADLLDAAILEKPNDARVLWYGGLSSALRGDTDEATRRWSRLLDAPNLPDNMRQVVQQQLAALGAEQGQGAPAPAPAGATVSVTTTIDVAPEMQAQIVANEPMFLIARDRDNPTPPIAVKRVRVGDFPVTIRISDNDVMIPGKSIKNAINLELVARISKSGKAFAEAGDIYGTVEPILTEATDYEAEILIDRVVGQ